MQVAKLYRYPVKSFTPETPESLIVSDDGRVVGDRILAFRFNDAGPPDDLKWRRKTWFASLQHTPKLARIKSLYNSEDRTLQLWIPGRKTPIEGSIDDASDRDRLGDAVTDYALTLKGTPIASRHQHQPLRLVGDGDTGRFHDTASGRVTMHSRASALDLAKALQAEDIDDARFRSNIVIEGVNAWDEFNWRGSGLKIGDVQFKVVKPVVRCLATHADPTSGARDLDVLNALTRIIGQAEPHFAVSLSLLGRGGEVSVGDTVELGSVNTDSDKMR